MKLENSGNLPGPHLEIPGTYSDSQRPPERVGVDGIPIGGRLNLGITIHVRSLPRFMRQRVPFGEIDATDA